MMLPNILSLAEYTMVLHALYATCATIAGTLIFILLTHSLLKTHYRIAMSICAVFLFIASLHSLFIIYNWHSSYIFSDGIYQISGTLFNDSSRYIDWFCTLPLLLIAFIWVLDEPKKQLSLSLRLLASSWMMVLFNYCGELSALVSDRMAFFLTSNIFLCYILYVLLFELSPVIKRESKEMMPYVIGLRNLIILSWPFYAFIFLIKMHESHKIIIHIQLLYCLIDVIARIMPSIVLFAIAYKKSRADNGY